MIGISEFNANYTENEPYWKRARDVISGSDAVKAAGPDYLPPLREDQSTKEYAAFLKRAYFNEASGRTAEALLGLLFANDPMVNVGENNDEFLNSITPGHTDFINFVRSIASEVVIVGRHGLLVDADGEGKPYITSYKAENIVNWGETVIDGRPTLRFVVLREMRASLAPNELVPVISEYRRVCRLETDEAGGTHTYKQFLYRKVEKGADATGAVEEFVLQKEITPGNVGRPFPYIPFVFINATDLEPKISKPPLLPLVNANLAHYINSADYENALHFQGAPPIVASGLGLTKDSKVILAPNSILANSNPEIQVRAEYLEV